MPIIKIDHIVSFSSEEPKHPAENLLSSDVKKTWRCKAGETSASVVLQLERATPISNVDICNDSSAFVEVLVGRSSSPNDKFKVLLLATTFMSPLESRNVTSTNSVRMFGSESFAKDVKDEKWDRVKVVCTQPFNKHIPYGLASLTLRCPDTSIQNQPSKIGRFLLKDDKEADDDLTVGSLFAKRKDKPSNLPLKGPAAIRNAGNLSSLVKEEDSRISISPKPEKKVRPSSIDSSDRRKEISKTDGKERRVSTSIKPENNDADGSDMRKDKDIEKMKHQPQKIKPETPSSSSKQQTPTPSKKRPESDHTETTSKKPKKKDNRKRLPFYKLLDGVVVVLSGYTHPLRGNIRAMAIQMGAKYKPDWGPGCTHLICAFQNTPKFREVRGKGRVVTKDWIEECHKQRKRLPWRRYALDKNDKGKPDSDEEIIECEGSDSSDNEVVNTELNNHVSEKSEEKNRSIGAEASTSKASSEHQLLTREELYNADTDVDSETDSEENQRPDTSNLPLPDLPCIFNNKSFLLTEQISPDERSELQRYIIAFKGEIADGGQVDYVITDGEDGVKQLKAKYPGVPVVCPQWIWECNDLEKLVPTGPFTIHSYL